jgi:dsDNA-specific endonuclease/ATPase MutS2
LFSLIASVRIADDGQVQPTFEIKKGLPLGRSYAQEIARRHGINLEQILRARQPE